MCPAGKICIVQRRNAVQLSQDPISSSGCRNPQPPILSQLIPTYANSMSLKDKTSQQWQHNVSLSYVKTFALWREMFFILFSSFVFCVLVQRKYWQLFSNWLLLNGWLRSLFSALQGLTVKPGAATTKNIQFDSIFSRYLVFTFLKGRGHILQIKKTICENISSIQIGQWKTGNPYIFSGSDQCVAGNQSLYFEINIHI